MTKVFDKKEYQRNYYIKNRDRLIACVKIYSQNNKEKIAEYNRKYLAEKRKKNIHYKLSKNFSRGIAHSLFNGKNGRKWEEIVGYSIVDLKKHIEKQFDNKMSWDNYGNYWHIDHIKPKALFNYSTYTDKEFLDCWSLDNLQPLEAKLNMSKGKKYNE